MNTTDEQQRAWRQAVAAQMKAERSLRSLDQSTMCELTGMSRSTYSRIERGGGATLDQLVAVALAFDLALPDLMARAEAEMNRRAAAQSTETGPRGVAGPPVERERSKPRARSGGVTFLPPNR